MMKTNGTLKTKIANIGEVNIPALIVGNFAIHEFIEAKDVSYYSHITGEDGNVCGVEKIERWAASLNGNCLNVSHVPSGGLVYCPKFRNCKGINKRAWLQLLKQFCADLEPMTDWSVERPTINDKQKFFELKKALPQGSLN